MVLFVTLKMPLGQAVLMVLVSSVALGEVLTKILHKHVHNSLQIHQENGLLRLSLLGINTGRFVKNIRTFIVLRHFTTHKTRFQYTLHMCMKVDSHGQGKLAGTLNLRSVLTLQFLTGDVNFTCQFISGDVNFTAYQFISGDVNFNTYQFISGDVNLLVACQSFKTTRTSVVFISRYSLPNNQGSSQQQSATFFFLSLTVCLSFHDTDY